MIFFANRYITKHLRYCILITLFLTQGNYAQKDSYTIPDSIQKKTIDELVVLIKESNLTESIPYKNALKNSIDSTLELAKIYDEIGYYFYRKEESDRSLSYFDEAIKIAIKHKNDELLLQIYQGQGNAYLQSWKNQQALDSYHRVVEMAQKRGDLLNEIVAKSNIVIVLRRMNQLDKAIKDGKDLLDYMDKTSFKNSKNHVNVLTIISEIYLDLEKFDSVLKYAHIGIEMGNSLDYKVGIADLYIKKGIVYYHRKDYKPALDYFYKAEGILDTIGISKRSNQSIYTNYFLASCFYETASYDKAINYLQEIINSLEKSDLRKNKVIDAHRLLALCYKEIGDIDAAMIWLTKHQELQGQFQKNKDRTVTKIYDKDTQKLDKIIAGLKSKQIKEKKIKKYILGILAVIFLVAVIICVKYIRKQKANQFAFNELINKISELENKSKIEIVESKLKPKDVIKKITIDDNKIDEILKGLDKLEKQEYFLSIDCNLRSIAKKVKTNATYLSKVINKHKDKNFNDYINDLRIDYVLQRLKNDKKFRSFSIKSIALEIGYKSDNSFTKHFKSKTGLNPSYYIKNIDRLE